MIDFADKTDGGEHYFFFGFNALKVQEPEQYREVVLVDNEHVKNLLNGEVEIAMSLVGLWMAMNYLHGFLR